MSSVGSCSGASEFNPFHSGKVRPRTDVLMLYGIDWEGLPSWREGCAGRRRDSSSKRRVDSPSGPSDMLEVIVTVPWEPVDEGGELKGFSVF